MTLGHAGTGCAPASAGSAHCRSAAQRAGYCLERTTLLHTAATTPAVGFVGLGDQGLPMSAAIAAARFPLHLWARRPETLEHVPFRFTRQDSVAELAAAVDVLAICVSTDDAVLDIARTAIPAMHQGAVFVNHGTGTPATARELAALGAQHAIEVLDAPVSGGRPAAADRTLTTIVGGNRVVFDSTRPVFDAFSAHVLHLGPAGSGQQAKLFNNALMLMNQHAIADILAVASTIGTDVPALVSALRLGSAGSRALELLGTMITPETAEHLSEVCLLDMHIFADAMRDSEADPASVEGIVADGADGARRLGESAGRLG
ncbi:3-hydroxyisobutyrate dehydrogenase-like beta-hydroxyacid dehydrogenase [Curtobacterium sp. PhB136]|nr:3-hydroxyisobutyrate dehydrogenase-like beta-hydroxyacid dehydrogenase [Curtobacterium sp. PhB136]